MGETPELIERLLAGPVDTELNARDLALLEAWLHNNRVHLSWYQQANKGMKCPELDRHTKLTTIRDYNRNLQRAAAATDAKQQRWIWDLCPLAREAWGNRQWTDDGTPAGQTIVISHTQTRFIVTTFDGGKNHVNRTVSRRFYIPTSDDLELLRTLYPQDDPFQPAWYVIKADLVAAGHDADKLDKSEAPVLLKLLGKATQATPKRSTEKGEGRAKLIAALTKHHQYADGGCLNLEPIGNNELARLAGVSESTASTFFSQEFEGHTKYRAICGDKSRLIAALKLLNQEFSPHHLFGGTPPDERERDDEE